MISFSLHFLKLIKDLVILHLLDLVLDVAAAFVVLLSVYEVRFVAPQVVRLLNFELLADGLALWLARVLIDLDLRLEVVVLRVGDMEMLS